MNIDSCNYHDASPNKVVLIFALETVYFKSKSLLGESLLIFVSCLLKGMPMAEIPDYKKDLGEFVAYMKN